VSDLLAHPALVALPARADADIVQSFVSQALEWLTASGNRKQRMLVSFALLDRLWNAGRYPGVREARSLLARAGVSSIAATDLAALFAWMHRDDQAYVETHARIWQVECRDPGPVCTWDPGLDIECREFEWTVSDAILKCTIAGRHGHCDVDLAGIAVPARRAGRSGTCSCSAEGVTTDCGCAAATTGSSEKASAEWFGDPQSYLCAQSVEDCRDDAVRAIDVALAHRARTAGSLPGHTRPWAIGPRLQIGLQGLSDRHFRSALRTMTEVISTPHSDPLPGHPLRGGEGPSSPQVRRASDRALAWRVEITKYGAGLRLHYWECTDGRIELASIGPHNVFTIPE